MTLYRLYLETFDYEHNLSLFEMSLTRDHFTLVELRSRLQQWLASPRMTSQYALGSPSSRFPFQAFADKYGEVATSDTAGDLEKLWLSASTLLTSGGLPTGLSPLNYLPRRIRVNASSLGALGEGIAGFYLERIAGLSTVARPVLVTPDLICESATGDYALVEVKTTSQAGQNIRTPMSQGAIGLLDVLVKNRLIRRTRYACIIIGVVFRNIANNTLFCELHSLRLLEP